VQTFLPYPDLRISCVVLDDRRLGKQRVETYQILRALTWPQYAWKNHPAVRMWRGFLPALVEYGLHNCREWTRRGYADAVAPQLLAWTGGEEPVGAPLPPWFGLEALHLSHRSALLRKDPAFYRPIFDAVGPGGEPDDLPYLWPPDVFPRWPVRAGHGTGTAGQPVEHAVRLLGYDEPRPGQAEAAAAAAAGRDVLLVARPGSGGSAAGLLAGLATPGRTLWVRRPWGPQAGAAPEVPLPAPRVVEAAGDRPPPIARPPGPEDLDAMLAETAEPEFVFATPSSAAAPPDLGLVVVDRADELDELEAARVAAVRGEVPLLVVVPRADAGQRAALAERFALRSPVRAGGGWDPAGTRLEVTSTGSPLSRRRRIGALVRAGGPGLVVVPSRERADRTAAGLADDGLRAAVWAPPPLRASRAAAAVGAWRSRRLDALVVPVGTPPPLGRARLGLLLDASDGTPEQWRDRLAELDPARSVLLVGPDAPDASQALAAEPGCLRAALLEPYGEPVEQPCGRCATCSPQPSA
jgi:hypothetical protein